MIMRECKGCGNEFQHVSISRGRPPVYCPTCRTERAKNAVKKEPTTDIPKKITYSGQPRVGDKAIRPAFHMFEDRDSAIRNATKVQVVSIDGDVAYVKHPSEKYPIQTQYSKLLKVNYA